MLARFAMLNKTILRQLLGFGLIAMLSLGVSGIPLPQPTEQKPPAKRRTTPLYASNKDGTPAAGLTAADLQVKLGGNPVEDFALTKGGSQNTLVFLVFDTASISSNLLSKSKKIAESTVSPADSQVRFVVMTIDPYAGLKPICGPTADKRLVVKNISKSVTAKRSDYFESRATDGTGIRDAYPDWHSKDPRQVTIEGKNRDLQEDRQVANVLVTSLVTLNNILRRFPESDKVVHLYSCGIPTGATADHTQVVYLGDGVTAPSRADMSSPDRVIYDQIKAAGQSLKKNGALVSIVNPSGTRVGEDDATSGEQSLHMLVNESSGRYYEGTDKSITQALIATEQGYYELSLPALPEAPGAEVGIEILAKNPEIRLTTVPYLARSRSFAEMTPGEKQAVIVSILTDGLVGDIDLKIGGIPVAIQAAGEEAQLTAQLPSAISQSEWDIYKVWRDPRKGGVEVEKEHVLNESPLLTFYMAAKENTVQDAVLVHAKTGTVLVCRGK
jgi:hypothetical protein